MTAPAPTVCPTCRGDEEVMTLVRDEGGAVIGTRYQACPDCRCDRCLGPVYTSPGPSLCNDCAEDLGDAAYERRADV